VDVSLPDWGCLALHHDGQSWVLVHQNGARLRRTDQIPSADATAARRWMREVIVSHTDATPDGMGYDADAYLLQRQPDGTLTATPTGGFSHDGRGWVLVDRLGHVAHRNDDIDADDHDTAVDWAHRINTSERGHRRRRWRLHIGQFPDGTYYDPRRRLGPQRARRTWNRLLDLLHIGVETTKPRPPPPASR